MASNVVPKKTPSQKRQETMTRKKLEDQAELRELETGNKGDALFFPSLYCLLNS